MQPTTQPYGDKIRLVKDFTVKLGALVITVKKGFTSDGASVPQIFWSLGFDPFSPQSVTAALVHDILYKAKAFDRKTCDWIFYTLLRENKVGWIKAHVYLFGVRVGGWLPWSLYSKKTQQTAWKYLLLQNNVL